MKPGLPRAFAALLVTAMFLAGAARAGGEYQGWEPLPWIVDIRFNKDAIGFHVAANRYVPGGPRFFELPRGETDWRRIDPEEFFSRFPSRRLPASSHIKDEDTGTGFTVLSTSDAEHFISTDYQCMEGFAHWAGIRRNGDWYPKHVDECVNIGAVESSGNHLFLGSTYEGEAGMFYGGMGIAVVNRETGALVKRIGYTDRLRAGGMIRQLRRDPFTGEVWAATPQGLWQIGTDLEVKQRRFFADVFDTGRNETVTRLVDSVKTTDHIAQYVRAMNLRQPEGVYAFLDARCEQSDSEYCGFSYMYTLGMTSSTNWYQVPGADVLLPSFLEAAAYADNGEPSQAFIEELTGFLHHCTRDRKDLAAYRETKRNAAFADALECFKAAGVTIPAQKLQSQPRVPASEPPMVPASSRFASPPREGRIESEEIGGVKIHAAWFAWRGETNESGKYTWRKRCVDFDTTRAGSDGYYRFEARHFKRAGNWFGAETEYRIDASGRMMTEPRYSEAPKLFAMPAGQLTATRNEAERVRQIIGFAERCQADGVENADLVAAIATRTHEDKMAQLDSAPSFELIPPGEDGNPLLRFAGPPHVTVKPDEKLVAFNVRVVYYDALDPESFRATLGGADVTRFFLVKVPGIEIVEMTAPPGTYELVLSARPHGADPNAAPETFTQQVVLGIPKPELRVQPAEYDPANTHVPILAPDISVRQNDVEGTNPYIERMLREKREKEMRKGRQ